MSHRAPPAVPVADLLEPLTDAHAITDLVGRIVYLNRAAEELLAVQRASVEGQELGVLLAPRPDVAELLGRWAGSASFRPATIVLADGRRLRCDGARMPHERLLLLRLQDHDRSTTAFQRVNDRVETVSLRALSRRLERSVAEVRAANQQLEAANEEIRQYARAVAHDIRNPLFTIQGLGHLLADELPADTDAAHYARLILESCQRLQTTTDGVLSVARLERATETAGAVDTNIVVAEAIADLAGLLEAVDADLVVEPLHPVAVEPASLRRVVQNLIGNSLQHAAVPGRPLRIEVASRREGALVELSFADDGLGIDEDERERIFELFQRGGRSAGTPGTGIGLASCRKTVATWGGSIACESRPGTGIRFVVTAPAAYGPPLAPTTDTVDARPGSDPTVSWSASAGSA